MANSTSSPTPQSSSIESMLNNIMGHTVDIANLLRAKEAAELAIKGGAPEKNSSDLFNNLLKQFDTIVKDKKGNSKLKTFKSEFRDDKGHFRELSSIFNQYKTAVMSSRNALNNLSNAATAAAKATQQSSNQQKKTKKKSGGKGYKDPKNFSYAVGRGKYASITPFMSGRTAAASLADMLSIGVTAQQHKMAYSKSKNAAKNILKNKKLSGLQKAGLLLGRASSGMAFAGTSAALGALTAAGIGALALGGMWAGGRVLDAAKTRMAAHSLAIGMGARGALGNWSGYAISDATFRARRMGLSGEEATQAFSQGQAAGLTLQQSLAAIASEKALGISNATGKSQTVVRRMGNQYANPSTYFLSLKPIAEKTKLSLEELSNATEDLAGSFKGMLDANAIRGLLSNFGDLVRTGEFSWGEISSAIGAPQRLSPTQQIAASHFAAIGGYQFNHSGLLGRAYEIQRMGGQDIGKQLDFLKSSIIGVLNTAGKGGRWDLLSDDDKYLFGNYVLNKMGITDFYNQPGGEKLMEKIMSGGVLSKEEQEKWNEATKSSVENIATRMNSIIHPLQSLNTLVAAIAAERGAGKVGDWAQSAIDNAVKDSDVPRLYIYNNFGPEVGLKLDMEHTPGMPVPIEANPKFGGK